MTGRYRWVPAAAAVLLLMGSISGCDDSPDAQRQSLGATLLTNLSDYEQEVLADKKVTRAEMQRTLQRYAQCVQRSGLKVVDSGGDVLALSRLQIDYGEDSSSYDASEKKVQECRAEFDAIDAVWAMQNAPSAEERRAALTTFVACLNKAGIAVAEGSGEDAAMQAYRQAAEAATQADPDATVQGADCASRYSQTVGAAPVEGLSDALAGLK